MKHINMSKNWKWSVEPFPAYRAEIWLGRNKNDRQFLPVKDIELKEEFVVVSNSSNAELGTFNTLAEATAAKAGFDKGTNWGASVKERFPLLPEGKFRVIKTREKGTILIVPGEDKTNRVLLFVDCAGGFRGGDEVVQEGTTSTILKGCSAANACSSESSYIVLMDAGQALALKSWGRYGNEVYLYTWDGKEVIKKEFTRAEWDERNVSAGEVEVL